jgi:hypothetical protein
VKVLRKLLGQNRFSDRRYNEEANERKDNEENNNPKDDFLPTGLYFVFIKMK